VLEAGAGVGRFTLDLAEDVREIHAFDFSPESIAVLRAEAARLELSNVHAEIGDLSIGGNEK